MLPNALQAMAEFVAVNPLLWTLSAEEIWARMMGTGPSPSPRSAGRAAIISLYGVLGRASLNQFTQALRAARSDPSVSAIVFDIDSPGGPVDGIPELANEIAATQGPRRRLPWRTR